MNLQNSGNSYLDGLFSLRGKVAVVIGGSGELGGAIAQSFAAAGAEVVVVGRNAEKAHHKLERIAAVGGRGWFAPAEASDKLDLENLLNVILARSGHVDILVNGAGVNSATPVLDVTEEEVDRILRVNYKSVFFGSQIFGKYMINKGQGGSIINLGSMSGVVPLSRVFTYSASKAAVHNLSLNLAREWAPYNIRVNVLVPGFFPAEQNRKVLTPDRVQAIMNHTPMKRFGLADELAGAALLLAGGAGSFITGTELIVDGGYHAMTI
jgi:NAD(P)-dependent dehydrogenase (short-subunit alcohol dehydrogenase family)